MKWSGPNTVPFSYCPFPGSSADRACLTIGIGAAQHPLARRQWVGACWSAREGSGFGTPVSHQPSARCGGGCGARPGVLFDPKFRGATFAGQVCTVRNLAGHMQNTPDTLKVGPGCMLRLKANFGGPRLAFDEGGVPDLGSVPQSDPMGGG